MIEFTGYRDRHPPFPSGTTTETGLLVRPITSGGGIRIRVGRRRARGSKASHCLSGRAQFRFCAQASARPAPQRATARDELHSYRRRLPTRSLTPGRSRRLAHLGRRCSASSVARTEDSRIRALARPRKRSRTAVDSPEERRWRGSYLLEAEMTFSISALVSDPGCTRSLAALSANSVSARLTGVGMPWRRPKSTISPLR